MVCYHFRLAAWLEEFVWLAYLSVELLDELFLLAELLMMKRDLDHNLLIFLFLASIELASGQTDLMKDGNFVVELS